ncbi:hypothetical protein IJD44_08310 [bacterium]|nr:hypothetical protein [bacterium]
MQISAITPNNNIRRNPSVNKQQAQPSFKGFTPEPVVNGLSNFYSKVASKNGFQKLINKFSNSNKTFTHLMVAESILLSGFYMINTLRNKKIDKEQKPQMLINDTLTLGVSAAGAYLLDDKVSKAVSKITDNFMSADKHKEFYSKIENVEAFKSGMSKLKTIVVFGLIYRYLGPVLITPLANKLSSKFFNKEKGAEKAEAKK